MDPLPTEASVDERSECEPDRLGQSTKWNLRCYLSGRLHREADGLSASSSVPYSTIDSQHDRAMGKLNTPNAEGGESEK